MSPVAQYETLAGKCRRAVGLMGPPGSPGPSAGIIPSLRVIDLPPLPVNEVRHDRVKNTLMPPKVHMESLDKEPEYGVALALPPGGTAWPMPFAGVWSRMGEETGNVEVS